MCADRHSRALIFANGDQIFPASIRAVLRPDDFLIAADGGLRHLNALGLQPALLIGDLDSVTEAEVEAARAQGARVEQHPIHKNETDLELAVGAALREGCESIRIVAALGGRLDMTLGNIYLLTLPELARADVRLEDGVEEVFIIRAGESTGSIQGQDGDTVSLLPLDEHAVGVRTSGLYYPLHGETLYRDRTRGISNRMTGPQAEVRLERGNLICIHTRQSRGEGSTGEENDET